MPRFEPGSHPIPPGAQAGGLAEAQSQLAEVGMRSASVVNAAIAGASMLIDDPLFRAGLRQFNVGEYFECHECLEERWKITPGGDDRLLLQGLIQLAVALLKWQQDNRRGALFLYHRSQLKWRSLPSPYAGLDLEDLRTQVAALFAVVEAASTGGPLPLLEPARVPVLRLRGAQP